MPQTPVARVDPPQMEACQVLSNVTARALVAATRDKGWAIRAACDALPWHGDASLLQGVA